MHDLWMGSVQEHWVCRSDNEVDLENLQNNLQINRQRGHHGPWSEF
jgi:hypothetical protein